MDVPSSFAEELRLDAQGYIDEDCHCVSCGYNLRGLNPHSICPECGTPIGRSAHGDFLLSIVLAFRYRGAFRGAANEARASWASKTGYDV